MSTAEASSRAILAAEQRRDVTGRVEGPGSERAVVRALPRSFSRMVTDVAPVTSARRTVRVSTPQRTAGH